MRTTAWAWAWTCVGDRAAKTRPAAASSEDGIGRSFIRTSLVVSGGWCGSKGRSCNTRSALAELGQLLRHRAGDPVFQGSVELVAQVARHGFGGAGPPGGPRFPPAGLHHV